jgi:hypothetical protein
MIKPKLFFLEILSGCQQSILSGICHLEKIVFWGINIQLRVIDSEVDSYFSVEPDRCRWIKLTLFFALNFFWMPAINSKWDLSS